MQSALDLPIHLPTITLLIGNMHCTSCSDAITYLLSRLPSVKGISTSLLLRTVTFQVDTSQSSSGRPTTIGKVVDNVMSTLSGEGGFTILAEAADGSSVATAPKSFVKDDSAEKKGWLERFGVHTKSGRERKRREDRRRKHLENCQACREQELEQRSNGQEVQPSQPSQPARSPATPSPSPNPTGPECVVKTTLSIEGMTCASCTSSITSSLQDNPAIISVNINLLGASGIIRHRASLSPSELASLVEDVGFDAQVVDSVDESSNTASDSSAEETLHKSTFSIEGMTCASCTGSITAALKDQKGVESVNIDLLGNRGVVVHSSEISTDAIIESIEEVGFGAELSSTKPEVARSADKAVAEADQDSTRTVRIRVEGMFCNDCVDKVNKYLDTLPLESWSPIALNAPTISVTYIPHKPLTIRRILQSLEDLAPEFEAEVVKLQSLSERSQAIQRKEVRTLATHCAIAVLFAVPTFIIAIVGMILVPGSSPLKQSLMHSVWGAANLGTVILWPLATIVQFGVGRLFYKRAFASLRPHLRTLIPAPLRPATWRQVPARPLSWRSFFSFGSMDLLVVLSTTVSYFASIAMLILDVRATPGTDSVGTYFDSCVFLIMFILIGRTLEAYAKSRTSDAVSLLGTLRPDTALLIETMAQAASPNAASEQEQPELGNQDLQKVVTEASDSLGQRDQARTRSIPADHLEVGDIILIQPGSLPPTDGIIVHGETTVDESSLTGESRPVTKGPGDDIFTGTINKSSAISIRVTRLAADTMLERIIHAVSDASSRKAPLEKLAEKLTGVFVPIIVYLSLAVLAVWLALSLTGTVDTADAQKTGGRVFFALEFAISTLVVACPCGIGLAVPCANAVGNGVAAKAGILASGGGEAFLAATKVTKVVFDKTGTLTIGKSTVIDESYSDEIESVALRRATIAQAVVEVESGSTHPLAAALVDHLEEAPQKDGLRAREQPMNVESSTEIPGRGLRATLLIGLEGESLDLLIGNAALMTEHNVTISDLQEETISRWSGQAKSVVLVAGCQRSQRSSANDSSPQSTSQSNDYKLRAMFSLSDPPRTTSRSLIAELKKRGLGVSMLSGDNELTARAVGKELGLTEEEVRGGVGPEGKAEVIRLLQVGESDERGGSVREVVLFVGDGLNDSVALAAADVSVAMGHGSQATLASADFVLLSSDLASILPLLSISRKIVNRQKLNLLWAIIFNLVCIPFAAGFFYTINNAGVRLSPVWSAVLMACSSVSVVASSLALRWGL